MTRCPVCNAKYNQKKLCHRCETNLEELINIKKQAEYHKLEAIKAFESNEFQLMHFHAKRSVSLHKTDESNKILACSAMLLNKFETAINIYNHYIYNDRID